MFEVNNCVTVRNSIWFYGFFNLDIWFYTVFWPATKNLLYLLLRCFACLRRWWRRGGFIWVYCWEFGCIHECCYEAMVQNIGDIPPLNWNLSLNTLHINVRTSGWVCQFARSRSMIIIFLFVSTLGIHQTAQKVRLVLLEPPIDITDGQVNDSIQSHFKSQRYSQGQNHFNTGKSVKI